MITSTTRTLSTGRQALSADLAGLSEIRRNPSRSVRHHFRSPAPAGEDRFLCFQDMTPAGIALRSGYDLRHA